MAPLLAGAVAYAGYRVDALSGSGAWAACIVGGTIFGFGGLLWAVLLILFFASSSLLSFFKASDSRKQRAAQTFEKGGRRDAAQALANGGVGAALALALPSAGMLTVGAPLQYVGTQGGMMLFSAYVGALAASTADTWATEIGVLSRSLPRMITTWKQAEAGTSGAVTPLGSVAGFGGALFIGLSAAALTVLFPFESHTNPTPFIFVLAALVGGIGGPLADSLLGATVQASYWCPLCQKPTESRLHKCGTQAHLVRGLPSINNDAVNFLATLTGALLGGFTWLIA